MKAAGDGTMRASFPTLEGESVQGTPVCYIFGAGEHFPFPLGKNAGDFIIAADGGYDALPAYGVTADLAVGDFDSLAVPATACESIILPKEKDDTDMAAALREGEARGYRLFRILGGTGKRLDHTFGNIQLLAGLAEKGLRGYLYGEDTIVTAIRNTSVEFPKEARGIVSVFSHTDKCEGVYERGLRYALDDAALTNRVPVGVSNEFTGEPSIISVRSGTLVIIYPRMEE